MPWYAIKLLFSETCKYLCILALLWFCGCSCYECIPLLCFWQFLWLTTTAHMAPFVWLGVTPRGRAEWKFASTINGALFVMTIGRPLMLALHANSLDFPLMVSIIGQVWWVCSTKYNCLCLTANIFLCEDRAIGYPLRPHLHILIWVTLIWIRIRIKHTHTYSY